MKANFLRQKAQILFQLSQRCMDLGVAERLRLMAAEFNSKADDIEDGIKIPAFMTSAGGQNDSDTGRH